MPAVQYCGRETGRRRRSRSPCVRFPQIGDGDRPSGGRLRELPNLATIEGGDIVAKVIKSLRGMGYQTLVEVLLAADYGVPQMRRRLFVVAARDIPAVIFPTPSHDPTRGRPYVTTREALDDLPSAAEFGECGVHNHEPTGRTRQPRLKPRPERSSRRRIAAARVRATAMRRVMSVLLCSNQRRRAMEKERKPVARKRTHYRHAVRLVN